MQINFKRELKLGISRVIGLKTLEFFDIIILKEKIDKKKLIRVCLVCSDFRCSVFQIEENYKNYMLKIRKVIDLVIENESCLEKLIKKGLKIEQQKVNLLFKGREIEEEIRELILNENKKEDLK